MERGIEANPNKYKDVIRMNETTSKNEVMKLTSMPIYLNRFVSKTAQYMLSLYKLSRKESQYEWTLECERAFVSSKTVSFTLAVLTRPLPSEVLYMYLVVSEEVVSVVLIREFDSNRTQYTSFHKL